MKSNFHLSNDNTNHILVISVSGTALLNSFSSAHIAFVHVSIPILVPPAPKLYPRLYGRIDTILFDILLTIVTIQLSFLFTEMLLVFMSLCYELLLHFYVYFMCLSNYRTIVHNPNDHTIVYNTNIESFISILNY